MEFVRYDFVWTRWRMICIYMSLLTSIELSCSGITDKENGDLAHVDIDNTHLKEKKWISEHTHNNLFNDAPSLFDWWNHPDQVSSSHESHHCSEKSKPPQWKGLQTFYSFSLGWCCWFTLHMLENLFAFLVLRWTKKRINSGSMPFSVTRLTTKPFPLMLGAGFL